MNIFDSEYRPKWKLEWEAHCQRVRAERLQRAREELSDKAKQRLETNIEDLIKKYSVPSQTQRHDEQRDLGYDDLRDSFNNGGVTGWDAGNDPNDMSEPRQE